MHIYLKPVILLEKKEAKHRFWGGASYIYIYIYIIPGGALSGRCFSMAAPEVANLVHKAMGAVVIPLPLQAITEEGWVLWWSNWGTLLTTWGT